MIANIKKLNAYLSHHETLLFLLLLTMLLRLPSLFEPAWYGDENIYLAIGQGIRKGLTLYSDITDFPNKPPLIYLFAAAARTVANFRLLLLFWNLANVAVIYSLAKRLISKHLPVVFTTLLFIFLTSTPLLEGNISNAEIFFILPTGLALWFLTQPPHTRHTIKSTKPLNHFLAGTLVGFAFLFKIHVFLDIAAFGFFFYILDKKAGLKLPQQIITDKLLWLFGFGAAIPVLLALFLWAMMGVSPTSLFLNAAGSSTYVTVWQGNELIRQTIGFGSLQARALLLLVLTLIYVYFKNRFDPRLLFFSLWTLFALFAVLLSARPYPHYLVQLVPPVTLGLGFILSLGKENIKFTFLIPITLILASLIRFDFRFYPVISYYQNFLSYATGSIDRNQFYRKFDARMPRNYQLAKTIRDITHPDERIYIWGTESGVYVLADRLPVEKLVVSFHVADLDYYDETIAALRQNPPSTIVYMESEWRDFPALDQFLSSDYTLIDKIGDPDKSAQDNRGQHALVYRHFKL